MDMLKKCWPFNTHKHQKVDQITFQVDGGPPYYSLLVWRWLAEIRCERVIYRVGVTKFCPSYSPDLNRWDFSSFEALKEHSASRYYPYIS